MTALSGTTFSRLLDVFDVSYFGCVSWPPRSLSLSLSLSLSRNIWLCANREDGTSCVVMLNRLESTVFSGCSLTCLLGVRECLDHGDVSVSLSLSLSLSRPPRLLFVPVPMLMLMVMVLLMVLPRRTPTTRPGYHRSS